MPEPVIVPLADVKIGVTFPFEVLVTEGIKAWSQARSEMDKGIRDRWDVIGVEMMEYAWSHIKKALLDG